MNSKRRLAIGSILTTFGAIGTFYSLLFGLHLLNGPFVFSIGFFSGVSVGLGSVLVLFNLRSVAGSRTDLHDQNFHDPDKK